MASAGLFCKTFHRDLERTVQLVESVARYNEGGLPLVVCVPEDDLALFRKTLPSTGLELVSDETLVGGPVVSSWRGQQVVKLNVDRLEQASHWLMLDADFYFIRGFSDRDFFHDGLPYFVCSRSMHRYGEDNPAFMDHLNGGTPQTPFRLEELTGHRSAHDRFSGVPPWRLWLDRIVNPAVDDRVDRIRRIFGRSEGPIVHVMPGPLLSAAVLRAFKEEFLVPRRLSLMTLIHYSPWEYHWYAEWLWATQMEAFVPREPYFIHFKTPDAVAHAQAHQWTEAALRARYLGVVLAAGQLDDLRLGTES